MATQTFRRGGPPPRREDDTNKLPQAQPEKYFDAHPEYFSLVKGKRLKQHSQLCCTNEEVIRLCTEAIRAAMRAQPDAT
ncbi:MAG TPA: DUF4838 domain-containing protein, partial [Bryobacteraceae bacterium]|nr:DUF4838 domain-containing protein [Bryobacteraceae bacterium]